MRESIARILRTFIATDSNQVLAVNLRGAFLCSREALKLFLEQGSGIILNNSSNHEMNPKPEFLAYSVSNCGLGNVTRTLALEYSDRGIRVNAVAPGATITPINASWKDDPVIRRKVESHIPLGRSATSQDGVFLFSVLLPKTYHVSVDVHGHVYRSSADIKIPAQATMVTLTFQADGKLMVGAQQKKGSREWRTVD